MVIGTIDNEFENAPSLSRGIFICGIYRQSEDIESLIEFPDEAVLYG